ncbi:hypothetical protein [Nostoc sp. 'Peltigera membranacea cyanobiont' 232]|uniref:hypothetical protein n=1 Tax=Nostoc sp. 'Peltigera membranacea cyanobiont' 232 TaxID=2014531 RepID=UPI000B958B80|nr:hypothetical protein [Nostoc sp. 'Peltigera membranacea cyanobiont' 232]OYE02144.1 hypothetical protein CDG79_25585 [Nostoc sp. 'Peltigera membranacea cyanobiont' 232]
MIENFSITSKVSVTLNADSGATVHPLFTYAPFILNGYRVINESLVLSNINAIAYIYSLPIVAFPTFALDASDSEQLLTAINLEWQGHRVQLDALIQVGIGNVYQRIKSYSLTNPSPYPYKEFTLDNQQLGNNCMLGLQIRNVGYGLLQNSSNGSDVITVSADLTRNLVIESVSSSGSKIDNTITTTASAIVNNNTSRNGISFFNNSSEVVYVDTIPSVSSSSYLVLLNPGDYYEAPKPIYTGQYWAVTSSGSASINIREFN